MLKQAQRGGRYATPTANELAAAGDLFDSLLRNGCDDRAKVMAGRLGMVCDVAAAGGQTCIALSEAPELKSGRGFYLFFQGENRLNVLQMPHSFKDLHTGDIGLKLAVEGRFKAAAWNTVPRTLIKDGQEIGADLSDLFDTYLAAFTLAYARQNKNGYVIQLHGYEKNKRKSAIGRSSDIILSTGSDRPEPWLDHLDACLGGAFSGDVRRYPSEIRELGATRTSIGILLHNQGGARFLHIEMSEPVRLMLRDDAGRRYRFLECLEKELR